MPDVAISLGSNLGDRHAHLEFAVAQLRGHLRDLRVSAFVETEPVGVGPQPPFLNGAVVGSTAETSQKLLATLLAIEQARGRTRPFPGAPRTLDLDLILYGQAIIEDPDLVVPHPRFRERVFVLRPLNEIAPEMADPVSGLTVRELFGKLSVEGRASRVRR